MMRLLMNLMQNAVVYGAQRSSSCARWSDADTVYVAVGDRGKGHRARRNWSSSRRHFSAAEMRAGIAAARGWGLSIVERIARLHGGSLQFHSREGGGLEVWVILPVLPVASE